MTRVVTFIFGLESSFAPGGAARPGLKMGYRSPVDVVTPWSC